MTDTRDSFFVKRDEWIDGTGKIYERINEVDREHLERHNELKLALTTMNQNTEQLVRSQNKTNDHLEKMNNNLSGFNDRITKVEYDSKETREDVDEIKSSLTEKQRGNISIWVAIISASGGILVAAIGIAEVFFR